MSSKIRKKPSRKQSATSGLTKKLVYTFLLLLTLPLTILFLAQSQSLSQHAQTVPSPALLGPCPSNSSCNSSSSSSISASTAPCNGPVVNQEHNKGRRGFLQSFLKFFLDLLRLILGLGTLDMGSTTPPSTTSPTTAPVDVNPAPSIATISLAPCSSSSSSSSVTSSSSSSATSSTASSTSSTATAGTGTKKPNEILDLKNWNLTIPVGNPTIISNQQLMSGYQDQYFHANSTNDGVVFHAPVNGPTTANSTYPRSELRELINGANAAWSSSTGTHTMTIDEAITALPKAKPQIVIGQIHDASDDVIVIRLDMPKLYVNVGGTNTTLLDANYTLGKRFTVKFEVIGGKTNIYYNNSTTPAYTLTKSYSSAYFKAGAYTQSNCTKETQCDANNFGESVIYKLSVTHQ